MLSTRWFVPVCILFALAAGSVPAGAAKLRPDASTVVAKQGTATVTFGDIDAFAQRMAPGDRPVFFSNPKRLDAVITNLLVQKQLATEARSEGLDKEPAVQAEIELASDDVLARARLNALREGMKMPNFDELAKEEYIAHKEKYVTPGELDVKHVLISTGKHSDEEARSIAEKVEKEAKAHPQQFDALIEKYSEDPSKTENRGLMRDARSSRYLPEFSAAANALKVPGEISPVIKTKYGYHVLQLVTRRSDTQKSFKDVRADIVQKLRDDYVTKVVTTHTDELRNQPIDAKKDLVASLRTRYGTAPTPPDSESAPATSNP